jgi:hypothetical protein
LLRICVCLWAVVGNTDTVNCRDIAVDI